MNFDGGQRESPKCYFTQSTLSHVDGAHPPFKKEPFRTVLHQPHSHTVSLLLPSSYEFESLQYARVYMKPLDLLTGEFFNSYIKSGDITMLSEGRPGSDDAIFSLADGILRIECDKPTYEKLGLEGKAVGSEGRKHVKARFAIEINLRLPTMLPGKKAFERLQWAFKNVLNTSLAWLFYDQQSPNLTLPTGEAVPNALSAHAPIIKIVKPLRNHLPNALVPSFSSNEDSDDETELLEWLSLAMARSPRVLSGDNLDPYLCRYRPDHETCQSTDLVLYQWNGFAPSHFVQKIVLAAMKATVGDGWFALGAGAFSGDGCVILRDGGDVRTWRFSD